MESFLISALEDLKEPKNVLKRKCSVAVIYKDWSDTRLIAVKMLNSGFSG